MWQLVIEPPAVLTNQLPVAVQVSVVAGRAEQQRGLHAVVGSRQSLPLYGCEAAAVSKLKVKAVGFQSSRWISVASSSSSSYRVPPWAGIGATQQQQQQQVQVQEQQVLVAGLQSDQPPQHLRICSSRSTLTGSLSITVSCSLWLFNCLGFQVAVRQPLAATPELQQQQQQQQQRPHSLDTDVPALGRRSTTPATPAHQLGDGGSSVNYSSSSKCIQVLWLRPFPWQSGSASSSSSSSHPDPWQAAAAAVDASMPAGSSSSMARSAAHGSGISLTRSLSTPAFNSLGLGALTSPKPQGSAAAAAAAAGDSAMPLLWQQQGVAAAAAAAGGGQNRVRFEAYPEAAAVAANSMLQQQQHEEQQMRPRRSISASSLLEMQHQGHEVVAAAAGAAAAAVAAAQEDGDRWQQRRQQMGLQLPPRPHSVQETASDAAGKQSVGLYDFTATNTDIEQQQQLLQQQGQSTAASRNNSRRRRYSSGLHMLASGRLPPLLLQEHQHLGSTFDSVNGQSLTEFDLLSPTHQQRLELLQAQAAEYQATAAAAAQQGGSGAQRSPGPVVLPLLKPDGSGWLPLLAAGDLNQPGAAAPPVEMPTDSGMFVTTQAAAAAAVAAAAPVDAGSSSSTSAAQQSAFAAAAADQLLQDLAKQQQQQPVRHSAPGLMSHPMHTSSPRPSSGTANVMTGQAAVGYGALTAASTAAGAGAGFAAADLLPAMQQPSLGVGLSGLAGTAVPASYSGSSSMGRAAAAAASAGSSSPPASAAHYAASIQSAGKLSEAPTAAAAAAASAVLCGWSCQQLEKAEGSTGGSQHSSSDSSSSSIELQLCAAPAAVAAALAGRGVQQLPISWSLPAKVELRKGGSGPAGVLKLPLILHGAEGGTSLGRTTSAEAAAAASAVGRGAESSKGGMLVSGSVSALSTLSGSTTVASGSTVQAVQVPGQRGGTGSTWGRWPGGSSSSQRQQQQQGVCFVSVHTAPVPAGGDAYAVHLLPTYLLVNTLQCEVQLRQYGSELVLQSVPPGGHCCVLWPDASLQLKLQFRVAEPGWSWSGAAAVDAPGEALVKIRHRNRGETLLLQLDVAAASSGIVATLSGRQGGFAPYRLDNCSCETIHVQQAGCVEQEDVLQPYSSLPFAWDEPSLPHRVSSMCCESLIVLLAMYGAATLDSRVSWRCFVKQCTLYKIQH
jgi:hypothetical protein